MLKNANGYQNQLNIECVWARDLPINSGFVFSLNGLINLYNDTNIYYEAVSVHKEVIIGFFRYEIKDGYARNYEYIRFNYDKENNSIFQKDFIKVRDNIIKTLKGAKGSVKNDNKMYRHIIGMIKNLNGEIVVDDKWTFFTVDSEKAKLMIR